MRELRKEMIFRNLAAFSRPAYYNNELIEQYELLEKEMVDTTFNRAHAEIAKLRVQDVIRHMSDMNVNCDHIADDKFERFMNLNKEFVNEIKKSKSGARGERLTLKHLEMLKCENEIISNLELSRGCHHTELDAVVFTKKAIFIIEVKNTGKDVYIDEKGNYIKLGEYSFVKSTFGEKMNEKEYLLKEELKLYGLRNPKIVTLLVFVDNKINVKNDYKFVDYAFLTNLPNIIDSYDGLNIYNMNKLRKISKKLVKNECKHFYSAPFNVVEYKEAFADLLSTLEDASGILTDVYEEQINEETVVEEEKSGVKFPWKLVGGLSLGLIGIGTLSKVIKSSVGK